MKPILCLFKQLPDVLKCNIITYFPIEKDEKLLLSIRKFPIYRKLNKLYKSRWDFFNFDCYNDWLANDIGRWMNDDEGLFYYVSPLYKKIVSNVFQIDENKINKYSDLSCYELKYSSKKLFNLYYNELTEVQSDELLLFCIKICSE